MASARARRIARLPVLVVGFLCALLVTLLTALGALNELEGDLLDRRFHWARFNLPPISDDILHVDIDSATLERVGRWPWNRRGLALIVDVLHDAGARAIVLDILMPHPQDPRLVEDEWGRITRIDDDAMLAEAIDRAGRTVVAAAAAATGPALDEDAVISFDRPVDVIASAAWGLGFVNAELVERQTFVRELEPAILTPGGLVPQLGIAGALAFLGHTNEALTTTDDALAIADELSLPLHDGRLIVPWRPATTKADRARTFARADDTPPTAWANDDAEPWLRVHPHLPAWAFFEVGRARDEFRTNRLRAAQLLGGIEANVLTDADVAMVDDNLLFFAEQYEPCAGVTPPDDASPAERLRAFVPCLTRTLDDLEARIADLIDRARSGEPVAADLEAAREEANVLRAMIAWPDLRTPGDNPVLARLEDRFTNEIVPNVEGKLVFVGWTATGAIADFYPTALGGRTPGVVAHAAIANGLLTNHWKRDAPAWLDLLATLLLGLTAALAGTSSVGRGWILALALALTYAAVNIWLIFDVGDLALVLGPPVVAATAAWGGSTLVRGIAEQRERARITRQFRSRVSAQLVDYLAEHPDRMNMEGEERELTMLFTDLAGFTALSEKLSGKRTVSVLNRCLRELTDEQLERRAYVNKFLGDGIMSFWGAPLPDDQQADHAVESVVACYRALHRINDELESEGLPRLGMRAGLATGSVIVGDCGAPPRLNDYTVIGDAVNLAARLESANKQLGTSAIVNATTFERLSPNIRDAHLWRRLGRLRVVGQETPVEVHELLIPAPDESPDELRAWIDETHAAIDAFKAGRIDEALQAFDRLCAHPRGGAGATMCADWCRAVLAGEAEADGVVVLQSK